MRLHVLQLAPFGTGTDDNDDDAAAGDRGSILVLTLVLSMVSALVVVALLTFVSTVLRVRPPVQERAVAAETARSAIRQAVHQQRVSGPDGCYRSEDEIQINGLDADVKCYVTDIDVDNVLMRNRFGVITTTNRSTDGGNPVSPINGSSGSSAVKKLSGDVFVNAGAIDGLVAGDVVVAGTGIDGGPAGIIGTDFAYTGTPDPNHYSVADPDPSLPHAPANCSVAGAAYNTSTGASWTCLTGADSSWTSRAGYNPVVAPDPAVDPWSYPFLPPKPTQERSSSPVQIPHGSTICNVYYPGTYPNGIDIDGGDYYFASGIYYFEGPVRVHGGARAVGGEGVNQGCVVDSEAALYDGPVYRAPKVHDITGNGVTFLLGDDATVDVTQASLILNRRLSTPTTRATEGVSIRSVNTVTTDTADVFVPEDQIFSQEGDPVVPASSEAGYADSEIPGGDYSSALVSFDATPVGTPSPGTRYKFIAQGSIFVPNGAIDLTSNNPFYEVQITGGTTSTLLNIDLTDLPSDPDDFFVGAKKTAVQSEFRFDAFVTSPSGRETESSAVMQLNVSREYALNTWTLDIGSAGIDPSNGGAGIGQVDSGGGGSGNGGGSGSGTSGQSTSGGSGSDTSTGGDTSTSTGGDSTSGGDTTGGDTTGGDTTGGDTTSTGGDSTSGGDTTGGDTTGGSVDECAATPTWHGDYFDNRTLQGVPLHTSDTADLDFDWGSGSPGGAVSADDFSARFNRKITVPTTGMYTFTISGDNGTRLFVNGVSVYDHWINDWNYTDQVQVELHDGCANDVTLEYFEGSGGANVSLGYEPYVNDPCLADSAWTGEYWDNQNLSGTPDKVVDDIDSVDFDWGSGNGPTGSNDHFSARWTKKVSVSQTGPYVFTMGGDDGYRVKVNGVTVIDEWDDHAYQTTTAEVQLNAGCANEIVVEFYENGGRARASLVFAPKPVPVQCTGTEDTQFHGRYYDSKNFTKYKFSRDDDSIDFDWGKNGSPDKSELGKDKFSIRWDRSLRLAEPGTYRFSLDGNDGIRLRVNGDWVIDEWDRGNNDETADVAISDRCDVDIRVEYFENTGKARVELDWEKLHD